MPLSCASAARILLAATVLALPLASSGCGRRACFTWSKQEGTCPSQAEALPFFTDPMCPGQVVSVDSAPTPDANGQLCCYDVTERALSEEARCNRGGFGGSAAGEFDASSSFVAVGAGGAVEAAGPAGAGGAGGACSRCAEALTPMQPGVPLLCSDSAVLFKLLFSCVCGQTCGVECGDNFCTAAESPSEVCFTCLTHTMNGCLSDVSRCENDL